MRRLLLVLILGVLFTATAHAEEAAKPDDRVIFDVSAENWVTTKTARVTVNVEAAVSGSNAGTMRGDMLKAVNDIAKNDWRLTSFNRSQDQTGLERWSALFEARVPETDLNGLSDNAKKASKAGMQLVVGDIDFSPTLEEMEATRAGVRAQIYKLANDQLTAINNALPGRNYRIALINFTGEEEPVPMPQVVRGFAAKNAMLAAAPTAQTSVSAVERAEKVTLTARVVFAATEGKVSPAVPDKR